MSGEFLPQDEVVKVTKGIVAWIQAERRSSNSDRNSYLDQLDKQRSLLELSMDDPSNQMVNKLYSHIQRLPIWFQAFSLDPTDDYQTGKIIFSPLMLLSGTYRQQHIFQATDQEDYYRHKSQEGTLISDVNNVISTRIGLLAGVELDLESLQATSRSCIETALRDAEVVSARAASKEDYGKEDSQAVTTIQSSRQAWLGFAADLIIYARQLRGQNLAAVPFLEAKSISDEPQVYYPFVE